MKPPARLAPPNRRGRRTDGDRRSQTDALRRRRDEALFASLAADVLGGRDRDRRGGDVVPDGFESLGGPVEERDPTGTAAVRRVLGDHPHDVVHERVADTERALARVADRLRRTSNPGGATP